MSPPRPAGPPVAIGATLAKLTDMLDAVGGTVDPDRRRAAACLSDLVRSADDDLAPFAERHLPGREVDVEVVKDARELAVELARLVGRIGEAPGAAAALRELRELVSSRLEALERGEPAPVPAKRRSSAPPTMPAPPVAPSLPTFMQSPPPAGFASFTTPTPPPIVPPPAFVPQGGALPFAPSAAPASGAADVPPKPGAPTTGLPFTRDPQRRG